MSGPENNFIASVHRHLPPLEEFYHMKNHNMYNGGIADVWYSGALDLWVEYKFIAVPKRDDTLIDMISKPANPKKDSAISSLQQKWLKDRYEEGRNVGVIVGSKDGGVWFPGDSWNKIYTAKEFRESVQTRQALAKLILNFCS